MIKILCHIQILEITKKENNNNNRDYINTFSAVLKSSFFAFKTIYPKCEKVGDKNNISYYNIISYPPRRYKRQSLARTKVH